MKFVIGFIALIFVALAVYTYTDKKGVSVSKSVVTHKVEKVGVTEAKVSEPVVMKAEKTPSKPVANKSIKKGLVGKSTSNPENEMGKVLTLESIENMDISDEEKERMVNLEAYKETSMNQRETSLSEEDFLKILKNHFDETN